MPVGFLHQNLNFFKHLSMCNRCNTFKQWEKNWFFSSENMNYKYLCADKCHYCRNPLQQNSLNLSTGYTATWEWKGKTKRATHTKLKTPEMYHNGSMLDR